MSLLSLCVCAEMKIKSKWKPMMLIAARYLERIKVFLYYFTCTMYNFTLFCESAASSFFLHCKTINVHRFLCHVFTLLRLHYAKQAINLLYSILVVKLDIPWRLLPYINRSRNRRLSSVSLQAGSFSYLSKYTYIYSLRQV